MRGLETGGGWRRRNPAAAVFSLAAGLWIAGCGGGWEDAEPLPRHVAELGKTEAGETILRAVRAHGGWNRWAEKESVEYDFHWTPYTRDGSPGMASSEHHRLLLTGPTRIRIDRPQEDLVLAFNGRVAWVELGSTVDWDPDRQGAAEAVLQRKFWMFRLPFNLVSDSLVLRDEGAEGGLRKVRIDYPIGVGGSPKNWFRTSFDEETGLLRELLLYSPQGKKIIVFSDYRDAGGIRIARRRRVHEVLEGDGKGRITQEIGIRNVSFNAPMDPDIFDPPAPFQETSPPAPSLPPATPDTGS